jgi:DNA-binding HxlR family transcriptional regulator
MSPRRSQCPVAYALDVVGDRWSLLVLRDALVFRKRTFREFLDSQEGIATNILTARLEQLCAQRFLKARDDETDARRVVYFPTEKALSTLPVLAAMARWSVTLAPTLSHGKPAEWLAAYEEDPSAVTEKIRAHLGDGPRADRPVRRRRP